MNPWFERHPREELSERYALSMLSEEDCKLFEEHLLICSACHDILKEADQYIRVVKAALALTVVAH